MRSYRAEGRDAIPMTRVLGAILITGYFGGAIAAHMLAGDPIGNFIVPTHPGAGVAQRVPHR